MTAIDTSIAVPALSAGHPDHVAAHAFVAAQRPSLPAHAALETYAVLTRLPAPAGVSAEIAARLLKGNFARRILPTPRGLPLSLLAELSSLGIAGGAVYDALIAATVRAANIQLVTADRRAAATYERMGVDFRFLDGSAKTGR